MPMSVLCLKVDKGQGLWSGIQFVLLGFFLPQLPTELRWHSGISSTSKNCTECFFFNMSQTQ